MKQSEKTLRSRQRIIDAAIAEFGAHGYDKSSINRICTDYHIPKGLIYHNFKNKDELYLQALKACLDNLLCYLKENESHFTDAKQQLSHVLSLRQHYFDNHVFCRELFFQSKLQIPSHLQEEIIMLHSELDQYFSSVFQQLLNLLSLRENITPEMAMDLFDLLQKTYHSYFQQKSSQHSFSELIEHHEGQLPLLLNVLLFGIAIK